MPVFGNTDFSDHQQVCFFADRASGLRAIIAIHLTVNGIAAGGIRMYPYAADQDAVRDALRLSRAMTYKLAVADLPVGGGKSVIIGDPRSDKTEARLEAFGRAVESLGGRYTCGEDVGTTPEDMAVINRTTQYVVGLPGQSGDTSPLTGLGIFHAIRAAAKHKLGRSDLEGLTVAVQGVGNVGRHLCKHLAEAGAKLYMADIDDDALHDAATVFGAERVSPDRVLSLEVDVVAPCALGAVINDTTVSAIKAPIVFGGANNQLAEDRHGGALHDRGILYVPDYIANAGGSHSASRDFLEQSDDEIMTRVVGIHDICLNVFRRAEADDIPTSVAADRLAEEIIRKYDG